MNAKKLISILLCVCMMTGLLVVAAHAANPTITFDDTSKRTSVSNQAQVWVENGITVTNDKGASTSNVNANYFNPMRCYQNSNITVEYAESIAQIIFTCDTYKEEYPTVLAGCISGADVTVDGVVVTATLNTPATSFTVENLTKQVRLVSIEVVVGNAGGSETPDPDPTPDPTPDVDYSDAKSIVEAAYALGVGESLPEEVSLTGKVTKINTPYDSTFQNISVTIEVEGVEDKPMLCYRLKGDDAAQIALGDTITVTGTIINYNGTIEFTSGCSLDDRIPGENEAPVIPTDPKEIVDAAFALDKGASLPYMATLTGTITEIVTPYDEQYKNITVTIEVEGTDGKKIIECYRLKGEGAENLAVGDVIAVTGQLTRYYKAATEEKPELDKIEFNSGCTFVPATIEGGDDNTGDDTTGGDNTGDITNPETSDMNMFAIVIMAVLSATTVAVLVVGKKKLF